LNTLVNFESALPSINGQFSVGVNNEAAKYVPMEQLALSPQCGFSSTVHGNNIAVQDQKNKLRLVIETANEVWGES
jgi:hypothetical protein